MEHFRWKGSICVQILCYFALFVGTETVNALWFWFLNYWSTEKDILQLFRLLLYMGLHALSVGRNGRHPLLLSISGRISWECLVMVLYDQTSPFKMRSSGKSEENTPSSSPFEFQNCGKMCLSPGIPKYLNCTVFFMSEYPVAEYCSCR